MRARFISIAVLAISGMLATACSQPGTAGLAAAGGQQGAAALANATSKPAHARHAPRRIRYLGVYERGVPASYAPVEQFATAVGRQPNVVTYYSGWGERFQASFARTAFRHGAAPLIDLDPYHVSMASIAAGDSDAFLTTFAHAVRRFGHKVLISFAHEPNGAWYRWGWTRTSPAVWIAGWRHVVTLFRAAGASNVKWVWTVNRVTGGEGPIRDWWPGAKYVTWASVDGYYELAGQTFATVFGPTITAIRKLTTRPIFISETAAGQVAGQAAKIPGLFAGVRSHHLLGFLWFDKSQHGKTHHQDWRIEGNPAAIAAFRKGLRP